MAYKLSEGFDLVEKIDLLLREKEENVEILEILERKLIASEVIDQLNRRKMSYLYGSDILSEKHYPGHVEKEDRAPYLAEYEDDEFWESVRGDIFFAGTGALQLFSAPQIKVISKISSAQGIQYYYYRAHNALSRGNTWAAAFETLAMVFQLGSVSDAAGSVISAGMKATLRTLWNLSGGFIWRFFKGIFFGVKEAMEVSGTGTTIARFIYVWLQNQLDFFTYEAKTIGALGAALNPAKWDGIFRFAYLAIKDFAGAAWNSLPGGLKALVDVAKDVFSKLWDWVSGLMSGRSVKESSEAGVNVMRLTGAVDDDALNYVDDFVEQNADVVDVPFSPINFDEPVEATLGQAKNVIGAGGFGVSPDDVYQVADVYRQTGIDELVSDIAVDTIGDSVDSLSSYLSRNPALDGFSPVGTQAGKVERMRAMGVTDDLISVGARAGGLDQASLNQLVARSLVDATETFMKAGPENVVPEIVETINKANTGTFIDEIIEAGQEGLNYNQQNLSNWAPNSTPLGSFGAEGVDQGVKGLRYVPDEELGEVLEITFKHPLVDELSGSPGKFYDRVGMPEGGEEAVQNYLRDQVSPFAQLQNGKILLDIQDPVSRTIAVDLIFANPAAFMKVAGFTEELMGVYVELALKQANIPSTPKLIFRLTKASVEEVLKRLKSSIGSGFTSFPGSPSQARISKAFSFLLDLSLATPQAWKSAQVPAWMAKLGVTTDINKIKTLGSTNFFKLFFSNLSALSQMQTEVDRGDKGFLYPNLDQDQLYTVAVVVHQDFINNHNDEETKEAFATLVSMMQDESDPTLNPDAHTIGLENFKKLLFRIRLANSIADGRKECEDENFHQRETFSKATKAPTGNCLVLKNNLDRADSLVPKLRVPLSYETSL